MAADVSAGMPEGVIPRLCFTLCFDVNYLPGAAGTIRSIRKFYTQEEADIVVFVDRCPRTFVQFCELYNVEIRYFREIQGWVLPLIYSDPRYIEDSSHYYHPKFRPAEGLHQQTTDAPGFHRIRHLHPLNVKAYCTGYCLCVKPYQRVIHIDADAFLLARMDSLFEKYPEQDTVIAFNDGTESLDNLEKLYGVARPGNFNEARYALNGGLVLYANGPGVQELARDFMFYIESCHHYTYSGHFADQGILRALVAKHEILGNIHFHLEDGTNWNPTWFRADALRYDAGTDTWVNQQNGRQQFAWHSAGGKKLWTGEYSSDSVNAAWHWAGGMDGSGWKDVVDTSQPYWEQVLTNENYNEKLCFTTSLNQGYIHGGKGLIRSIRKFYSPEEADIILFVDQDFADFPQFCAEHSVELRYASDVAEWVLPLVYEDPAYASNKLHYYHPEWQPAAHLGQHQPWERSPGFHTLRHLHPLNMKAYCTGYCLCVGNYRHVAHIDGDAFLLGRIDEVFEWHPEPDTIIAFDDEEDELPNLEPLFGIQRPAWFQGGLYGFNAGIVMYVNGSNVKQFARDFMFYVESCYHYTYAGFFADQGLIRALVAVYDFEKKIHWHLKDGTNWNPTFRRADSLYFEPETGKWINARNREQQRIWHAPAKERLWTGEHRSTSVNEAWRWIGGEYELKDWRQIPGRLAEEKCLYVPRTIADFFSEPGSDLPKDAEGRPCLRLLEVGTHYGRTAVAYYTELTKAGFSVEIDTCDIFAPHKHYPDDRITWEGAMKFVRQFSLEDKIHLYQVGENENLAARFGLRRYDAVYIDACHEYKQVLAECFMALKMVKTRGMVLGDDWGIPDVREAVVDFFGEEFVHVAYDQWVVPVDVDEKNLKLPK